MDGIRPGQMKLGKPEGEDCKSLRALWEEVFYGDSRKFTDYYFKEKAALNHGYVLRDGEMPVSMLYLSPYPVMLRSGDTFACRELNYIVGVATKEPYRHRGCMDRLLKEALRDMYGKAQPFTFLMPADCAIYRPYQFTYIYRRAEYTLGNGPVTGRGKTCTMGGMKKMGKEDLPFLAEFAQAYMERHYDVFIRRDIPYFTRMEKELQAQEGGIFLAGEKDGIKGYLLYAEEEQGEIQEAVWEGEYGAWGLPAHPCVGSGFGREQRDLELRVYGRRRRGVQRFGGDKSGKESSGERKGKCSRAHGCVGGAGIRFGTVHPGTDVLGIRLRTGGTMRLPGRWRGVGYGGKGTPEAVRD